MISKLPPQAIEIECAILGAFAIQSNLFSDYGSELKESDFYDTRNLNVFKVMISLDHKRINIDLLTIVKESEKMNLGLDSFYIANLTSMVASTANIETHIAIVKQEAIKRKAIESCNQIIKQCYDTSTDSFDIIDQLTKDVDDISATVSTDSVQSLKSLTKDMKDRWIEIENNGGMMGVMTGLSKIDDVVKGFKTGNLIIIAGRPGMGKTTLAIQIARNVSKQNKPVGFITLEMTAMELYSKIVSGETNVNSSAMMYSIPADFQEHKINEFVNGKMAEMGIYFVDASSMNIQQMKSSVRKLKREFKCELVIIDYIQLMDGNGKGNREQEVSSISRSLKSTAKLNDIPIIALSQLSRSVETRGGDKRPQLSDLRESGAIEQDADLVSFVYRPEYYDILNYSDGQLTANKMELIVAKHRGGKLGSAMLQTDLAYGNVFDIQEPIGEQAELLPSTGFSDF